MLCRDELMDLATSLLERSFMPFIKSSVDAKHHINAKLEL
jgi:hypothetical protein